MGAEYVNIIQYSTYYLDEELRITKCDDLFTKMTGYTWEDVKQNDLHQSDLIFEEDREAYFALVQKHLAQNGEAYIEHRIKCKDGSSIFVFCLGASDVDQETGKPYSIIRVSDVTDMISMRIQAESIRNENNEEMEILTEIANTDELTGALRRGAFMNQFGEKMAQNKGCAMIMMDVDDFKSINDVYGHNMGDETLKQIVEMLKKVLRGDDLICRMGGDEFAILLYDIESKDKIVEVVERIMRGIDKLKIKVEDNIPIKISLGIKICRAGSTHRDFKNLYIRADRALYLAKQQGKNCYVFYDK